MNEAGRPASSRLRAGLRWTGTRLRERTDSEHEMAFNRLVFAVVIALYLVFVGAGTAELQGVALYGVIGIALLAHILAWPARNPARRWVAMACDFGMLSFELHVGGEVTSVLFPIYLWIALGNGFRFGVPWLQGATIFGLSGFVLVVATTPFWRDQEHLSAGLIIGLLIVPLYAGTLIRKLHQETRRAEDASRAKSMFLASVSHELRTPLNAIIGLGSLLRDTRLDEEQRDMAVTMDEAAKQQLALIDDILDFSRIEAGQMPVHIEEFDLVPLMGELRAMFSSQAREKALRLSTHLTLRSPTRLRGDPLHLKEVLQNLVGNALKFTEAGSVVIAADAVEQPQGGVLLRFEVTDTGIGIAPDAMGRIFESFTQADQTIISRFGGTGLGLAICQRLVKLLGGEIGVNSTLGAGSTFWFTMPVETVEVPAEQDEFANTRLVLLAAPRPQSVRLATRFAALGVQVQTMPTVAQAAAALHTRGPGPRPALLVWPEQLGIGFADLISALRALDPSADTPVLLVTDEEPVSGLPEPELRRSFQALLHGAAEPAQLRVALHVARNSRAAAAAPSPAPAERAGPRHLFRILLADDNRTNQRVISKILERAGHKVVLVDNGEQALDALEASRFDIVLMDLNMPVLDGLEATKLYRVASLGQPRVPIIALTADATPEATRRSKEAGMDACLHKPVQPARLLEIIEQFVAVDAAGKPEDGERGKTSVADIAAHPRFRPVTSVPLDDAALKELRDLGGDSFVDDLVAEFLQESAELIDELRQSVAAGDAAAFRNKSHALRSSAANVGARAIYELCRFGENAKAADLASQGMAHVQRLTEELERVRGALPRRRPDSGQAKLS